MTMPDGVTSSSVEDSPSGRPVVASRVEYQGSLWSMVRDEVDLGDGVVGRDYVVHPGAVAIMVLDDQDRLLLQRQYRHPVRAELWEPPAGLLDKPGESRLDAAKRELAEEADLAAADWDVLVDYFTTPGSSTEAIRVFVARGLTPIPEADRYERGEEERDMESAWIPLQDAVALVLKGKIHNPSAVVGILALSARG